MAERGDHGATPDLGADDAIEAGRRLFSRECRFTTAASSLDSLPVAGLPEVAFAGRSNVGKSSLINALTGQAKLARTSNTPGRTQQINFFSLDDRLVLVDLPGYGYAQAPKSQVAAWIRLVNDYLRGRATLRRACLLVDSRHGLKDNDEPVMDLLDTAAVSYQVVLTKSDKLKAGDLAERRDATARAIARRVAAHPEIIVTSAETGAGVAELRAALAALAVPEPFPQGTHPS